MRTPLIYEQTTQPGCLLQLLWFVLVGWWLGAIWVLVAWLLSVTIIGAPIGAAMLNRVPQVVALRGRRLVMVDPSGQVREVPQINPLIRALYFVFIGIWFSLIWVTVAYLFCLTIIGLPLGFWMFDLTPTVVTLKRL